MSEIDQIMNDLENIMYEVLLGEIMNEVDSEDEGRFNYLTGALLSFKQAFATNEEIEEEIRQYRCDFPHDKRTDAQIRPFAADEIRIKKRMAKNGHFDRLNKRS